jgi:DNA polymerase-3 subunit alpha
MFTHLHTHTEFSLLDGMSRIAPLLDRTKEIGMEALAMTDHGALYGAVDFYLEATARQIKPIIGVEAYVARSGRSVRDSNEQPYHLVLLARNKKGYRNLMQLVTRANLEGFYYKPRMDRELLEKYSDGITVLSGCPSSEFFELLSTGNRDGAIEVARWYREIFDGNYFLEVQEHGVDRFSRINADIFSVGKELDIPVVVTNDSHYTMAEDHEAHDLLLCIGTNSTVDQEKRFRIDGEGYHLRSESEMSGLFPNNPEVISNTSLVADACDLTLDFDRQLLPAPEIPEGADSNLVLGDICRAGLLSKFGVIAPEYETRLKYELDVLKQTGFTDYIFVVKEIADYARSVNVPMGVRGSAAASLVLFSLAATDIDPVRNGLVFERFLNPERKQMPDVDFDFADNRRDEVIRFAYDRFGEDKVAQIITFGTLGARAAIRDVGRALGMSYGDVDSVARAVPNVLNITLEDALLQSNEMRKSYEDDNSVRRLIDNARRIEGVARHASTHAAGVVISREPLAENVPLQRTGRDDSAGPTTQFPMGAVEAIGLLKIDFLGLANLTILGRAVDLIFETTDIKVVLSELPDKDHKTMEMLGKGETFGVFQLESSGMRRAIEDLKPTSIADICALVALYRPGPMDHIPTYCQGKNDSSSIIYPHPDLEDILDETYGVIVYQDQVLLIARKFAGYSLGQADVMRKAMGKKQPEVMAGERSRFVEGAILNGYDESEANTVFNLIEPFAGYAFNKAHSWSYGTLAYQTAFLKAHYPVQFMTAVLQLSRSSSDPLSRIAAAAAECSRLGIVVTPPDINVSTERFNIEYDHDRTMSIRFGLGDIKGIGSAAISGMIAVREEDGPYRSVEDFCKRANLNGATGATIEHLSMSGAFDTFSIDRGTLRANSHRIVEVARQEKSLRDSGQSTMFDLFGTEVDAPMVALELQIAPTNRQDILQNEKDLLGFYVTEHPFRAAAQEISVHTSHTLAQLSLELAGKTVSVAGMVTQVTTRFTRDNRKFYIVSIEDLSGLVEITVWNNTIDDSTPGTWSEGQILLVEVECRERNDRLALSVRKAVPWDIEEARLLGFDPSQWQVEARVTPTRSNRNKAQYRKDKVSTIEQSMQPVITTEAESPTVQSPVNSETARLIITMYETDDLMTDRQLLKSVVAFIGDYPGEDEVRLVVHDSEGDESSFDLERASVSNELVYSIEKLLTANKGSARLLRKPTDRIPAT